MIRPVYRELSAKVEAYIAREGLTGRLPGVGVLSKTFDVNQVTLSKAMRLLERKGVVTIRGTRGTFVNEIRRPVHHAIGLLGLDTPEERAPLMDDLYETAERAGYQLLRIQHHRKLLSAKRGPLPHLPVDGLIFYYSFLTPALVDELRTQQLPIVVCNRWPELAWLDRVDFDHAASFRKAFGHLKELGHRRVAYVGFDREPEYRGYLDALRGLWREFWRRDFRDDFFHTRELRETVMDRTEDGLGGYALRALTRLRALPEPPTAVVAEQSLAWRLARAAETMGLRVPDDLSLLSAASHYAHDGQYTRLMMDEREVRRHALRRMLAVLADRRIDPRLELLDMPLLPGNTTAPPPRPKARKAARAPETPEPVEETR